MRIVIDARMINHTGIGRYTQNLITTLANIDKRNGYHIIINKDCKPPALNSNIQFHRAGVAIPVYSLREQGLLPFTIKGLSPDLVHYTNFNKPLFTVGKPSITTIHDLIYYLFPSACPSRIAHLYARFMVNSVVRSSKKIITGSEFSRNEIVSRLNIAPEKVVVIHNGVSDLYRPEKDSARLDRIASRYNINSDFILYVGNYQKRKNLNGLINAFSLLKERGDLLLVFAGKKGRRSADIDERIRELSLEERVRCIGEVPEEDLPALYSAARLFVFPSFYEGFGLPPLEAMACGTPVVTSNISSLPEVVGDAALKVNPADCRELSEAMHRVLSDRTLCEEMAGRGIERAARFDWKTTAEKTLDVYNEVAVR